MKKRSIFRVIPVTNVLLAFIVLMAVASYFFCDNFYVFIAAAFIAAVSVVATVISLISLQKNIYNYFNSVARSAEEIGSDSLSGFVMPLMVARESGEIVWYNDAFTREVISGSDIYGENESVIFDETARDRISHDRYAEVWYKDKFYYIYSYSTKISGVVQNVYYFSDQTSAWKIREKYKNSRNRVMYIQIDSLDMLTKNVAESEKASVLSSIEKEIEKLADSCDAFLQKASSSLYILIVEQAKLKSVLDGKFEILKTVREMTFGERGGTTLSIGVGLGCDTINESKAQAQDALDMAIGRGGDQAAIKTADGFEFFGGVAQATTNNTRIRTRVIAATLLKLIENSESVLLMGHSFSDMDCFGSAFGLWRAITSLERDAHIIVDLDKTLAAPLIKHVGKEGLGGIVVTPKEALGMMGKRTLLIILDTHRPSCVESKEVYEKAKTIVVIDHHRKTVDYIANSLVFYHDPSASSTCEMVSELLQYMGPSLIGKIEAEALLAGIMLDTRNLVLRTGTRTYEAAAYLRGRGADPVAVKKLFSDSMELYKLRTKIVAAATVLGKCAISICEQEGENVRLASSQAADELLSISGVSASFVLFADAQQIVISARSLGAVNVQLIMEKLGGGGHQTMAASQLEGETLESAKARLIDAINEIVGKD
jgi:c-di-AMP phosphodiesterase-like protein